MQIIQLDTQIYVGPQIWASDMATLNRMKIGTIIVARPEGETADQPTISAIREAADTFGIAIHQLPIVPGNITDDDVRGNVAADKLCLPGS